MIPVLTRDAERQSELNSGGLHSLSLFLFAVRDRCCPTVSFGITSTDKLLIDRSHYHNAVIPELSCDVNFVVMLPRYTQASSEFVIVSCSNFTCLADYLSEHLSGRMQMSGSDAEEECGVTRQTSDNTSPRTD